MILRKLREFLDSNNIKFVVISHSQAFRAQEVAASAHIPGKELAKTVMAKIDGKMTMVVLPASYKIDFSLFKEVTGATNVELASEEEFKDLFPECDVGAMPPFGNLFGMEVLAAEALAEDDEIAFNAGTHKELVKMAYKDFEKLVRPKVMKFSAVE
ncbi:MAG: YbaK/EbsC family protein [Ignavibacteria bacterium]|nr:YbaK/EbsC family protein [Ignavibacteria bacterium]